MVFWGQESSRQKEQQVSLPGGVRLYEMLMLRGCTMRLGQWETAELEGGSSSGRAQSSVQFCFILRAKRTQ